MGFGWAEGDVRCKPRFIDAVIDVVIDPLIQLVDVFLELLGK